MATADIVPVQRWAPRVARLLAGLVVVAAVLSAIGNPREVTAPVIFALWLVVSGLVGALVAARRPDNAVGWVLLAAATVLAVHAAAATASTGDDRGAIPWVAEWLSIPGFGLLLFVPLLFPTGYAASRRWRLVGIVAAAAIMVLTVATALRPQKMGVFGPNALGWDVGGSLLEGVGYAAGGVVNVCALLAAASLVVRMRRADPLQRQQIRWLVAGVAAMLVGGLFAAVSPAVTNELSFFVAMAGLTAVPVAIGIAILEYHLWDLDRVVNRTVVYGALTLVLGAVYVATVVGLAGVLDRLAGLAASVAATVFVALLVLPARDALQRLVDRLLYGDRRAPLRALRRLGTRLETAVDPNDAPELVVSTVRTALKLPYAALELEGSDGPHVVAAAGTRPGRVASVPVVANAQEIGRLVVDATRPLRAHDRELLTTLVSQAAPALQAARLTAQLQWSRERIVLAREEERRRLRAELHDGLGARLAGLTLGLQAAENLATEDPTAARDVITELQNRAQEAVAEVRQVVAGLRPPALDELGLVGGLDARARDIAGHLAVEVTADGGLGDLPAAVEVALYRIGMEAMTNVVRHASALHCVVALRRLPGLVTLTVDDDGCGIEATDSGFGLQSMRERCAEVGGTFTVAPRDAGGTTVRVSIPTQTR